MNITSIFDMLQPDIAKKTVCNEMENFFVLSINIYKQIQDKEYSTLAQLNEVSQKDRSYVLLWLVNEQIYYCIQYKNQETCGLDKNNKNNKILIRDTQNYSEYMNRVFRLTLEQLTEQNMVSCAVNLTLKSKVIEFSNKNPAHLRDDLLKSIIFPKIQDQNFANHVKSALENADYSLRHYYDSLGYLSYTKFDFSNAQKQFEKSENKLKRAECLYSKESPAIQSLPFSQKCPNLTIIQEYYEKQEGLELVDERLALVKNIFRLKAYLETQTNSIADVRDFALSFISILMKSHIETYYNKLTDIEEKYMFTQLITEQLEVLICSYQQKDGTGVKEKILNNSVIYEILVNFPQNNLNGDSSVFCKSLLEFMLDK